MPPTPELEWRCRDVWDVPNGTSLISVFSATSRDVSHVLPSGSKAPVSRRRVPTHALTVNVGRHRSGRNGSSSAGLHAVSRRHRHGPADA